MSVATRVSPVADEYETVWAPILIPLYRTENRRSPAGVGKTTAVAARATGGKAQLAAPANPPIRSARRGIDVRSRPGQNENMVWPRFSIETRTIPVDTVPRRGF